MKKNLLVFFLIQIFSISTVLSQGLSLPYTSGFDTPSEMAGWQQYRTGVLSNYDWSNSGGGFVSMCISHDYNVGGAQTDTVVDWYVSPPLNFTSEGTLAVKVLTSGFSTPFPDNFEVLFGTNIQDPSLGNFTVIASLSYMQPQFQWLDTIVNIPFISDSGYIAFKYKTIGAAWSTYAFDNVVIDLSPVSVGENQNASKVLKCFPNPFKVSTSIELPGDLQNSKLTLRIFDVLGKEIKSAEYINTRKILIEKDELPEGIYIVKIDAAGSGSYTSQIVIAD